MSSMSSDDARRNNPWANYFIRNRPFTMQHVQRFIEEITDMCPYPIKREHADLLCSAIIRIESTNDPLIDDLKTIKSMGVMVRAGIITQGHLGSLIEKHRAKWEGKVGVF